MGLEVGTFVSDLVSSNPPGTDVKGQGDDHLRLIKSVLQSTFPNASRAFRFSAAAAAKVANYTILASDENALIRMDATAAARTATLPLLSTVFAGYTVLVMKSDSSANAVTVDGNGAETINGAATRTLSAQYEVEGYMSDGAEWKLVHEGTLGLGALAALGVGTGLVSAGGNADLDVAGLTAETVPAVGDEIAIEDVSVPGKRKMTLENQMKIINVLTALTAPALADKLSIYDDTAAAARSITPDNLLKVIDLLTALGASVDKAADKIPIYDATAGIVKTVFPNDIATEDAAKAHGQFTVAGVLQGPDKGITSITDNGVGNWTVNLTVNFATADYAPFGTGRNIGNNGGDDVLIAYGVETLLVGSYVVRAHEATGAINPPGRDPRTGLVHTVAFGDQ
ncbi:MAG: hypothetical protein ACE5HV_00200 [Acidobacteriota bacterium]